MKNLMITLLITTLNLLATAQSFNEKTFMDNMKRFAKDPAQYMKTEATPDFILVGSNASVFTLEKFLALNAGGTTQSWNVSDVKVRQYGHMAVATGIVDHSHLLKHDGSLVVFKELFNLRK